MIIRHHLTSLQGKPIVLVGDRVPKLGEKAPDFLVSKSVEEDLRLGDLAGKVTVLNVIPSIDTPVCSVQTARFNQEAGRHPHRVAVVSISMDLPFAIHRWCQAHAATNLLATSDYKHHDFGRKFSVLMQGSGLLARAVYVIDPTGVLRHEEIVPALEQEPNYDSALETMNALLQ